MKKRINTHLRSCGIHVRTAQRFEEHASEAASDERLHPHTQHDQAHSYALGAGARFALAVESLLTALEDGRCTCGHVLDRSWDSTCRHCARLQLEEQAALFVGVLVAPYEGGRS